ncbi:unnamed protein product, partial [marine sediment metagenome]
SPLDENENEKMVGVKYVNGFVGKCREPIAERLIQRGSATLVTDEDYDEVFEAGRAEQTERHRQLGAGQPSACLFLRDKKRAEEHPRTQRPCI